MQGSERMDRQLLDAEMLAGHLVPAGSMFAFLAGHRAEVFPIMRTCSPRRGWAGVAAGHADGGDPGVALTLWALPDDVSEPQRIRGHGADPKGKVDEWLRMDPGYKEHPLVKEAAGLAVRALQTRRPERFLWIDEASVVSQIGTEVGAPGEPRLHNLWIPPSTGWSSLDFKAQQLLADVLLLVVLGERDSRPKDLFRLLERVSRTHAKPPSCLSRDRTRLDPVRAVESDVQPGDYCRDDCELRMCPYPVKAKNLRVEFNELFCLHQRAMLNAWQPQSWLYLHFRREAPWQRQVPVTGMRRFWEEMGERARDTTRPR